jgi:hypothetical protein
MPQPPVEARGAAVAATAGILRRPVRLLSTNSFPPCRSRRDCGNLEAVKDFDSAMMLAGALTGQLSCGHSETGQTNRRDANLDGHALNARSETALNSAVVRSCHFRPAPFRCRFHNVRSVRFNFHQMTPSCAKIRPTCNTTDS